MSVAISIGLNFHQKTVDSAGSPKSHIVLLGINFLGKIEFIDNV